LHVILLITPVFALIVAGYYARRTGFIAQGFWAPAEKLGYWVLLPALIIDSLATNKLPADAFNFALAIALTVVLMSVPMLIARRIFGWEATGFASVHQGSLRLNGLLAIAVSIAMFGPVALPLMGVLVAAWIPLSNGLSVYAFVASDPTKDQSPLSIAIAVIKNPMIFAVLIGASLNILGIGTFIEHFFLFELLGRAALPIGLLTVGAALNVDALRRPGPRISAALALKLVVQPLIMLALCSWLATPPLVTGIAVLCAAMPSSPSGYTVAKQMRGDHELMATIITAQTILSVVTVTAWAMYASSLVNA
jgi:malonate transporter and related proteins